MMSPFDLVTRASRWGRWWMLVFWLERWCFIQGCRCRHRLRQPRLPRRSRGSRCGWRPRDRPPPRRAATTVPGRGDRRSMRCHQGLLGTQTADHLALHVGAISARFASSFSRNGISEAATETICDGATSIFVTDVRATGVGIRRSLRPRPGSSTEAPSLSRDVRLGDDVLAFFHGHR